MAETVEDDAVVDRHLATGKLNDNTLGWALSSSLSRHHRCNMERAWPTSPAPQEGPPWRASFHLSNLADPKLQRKIEGARSSPPVLLQLGHSMISPSPPTKAAAVLNPGLLPASSRAHCRPAGCKRRAYVSISGGCIHRMVSGGANFSNVSHDALLGQSPQSTDCALDAASGAFSLQRPKRPEGSVATAVAATVAPAAVWFCFSRARYARARSPGACECRNSQSTPLGHV